MTTSCNATSLFTDSVESCGSCACTVIAQNMATTNAVIQKNNLFILNS